MRSALALVSVALCGSLSLGSAASPCDPDAISVQSGTLSLQDGCGRQRFFRGANAVTKLFPFVPPTDHFDPATSFSQEDAALIQSMGWNLIRLGTMWPGVMPTSAAINTTYLQALTTLSSIAASRGVYSLLDAHQDTLSDAFCGEGMPSWVAHTAANGSLLFPMPVRNESFPIGPNGLPSPADCGTVDWTALYFSGAVSQAFQNLYAPNGDTRGIRAIFQRFWQAIVEAYANAPAVSPSGANGVAKTLYGSAVALAEILNEPWSGDVVRNPLLIVPGVADRVNLQPFYYNVTAAIRAVEPVASGDARRIVSYESVTFDDFIPVGFDSFPDASAGLAVLNFHYYNLPNFNISWQVSARVKDATRLGAGLILSEFDLGQDLADITSTIDVADASRVSWTGWEYKSSFITGADESFWNADGTLNTTRARTMARPGPNAVGGETSYYLFNSSSATFSLAYTLTQEALDAAPQLGSEIYVPTGLWYGCSGSCLSSGALNITVAASSGGAEAVSWKFNEFPGAVIPAEKDGDVAFVKEHLYGGRPTFDASTGAFVAPAPFAYGVLNITPSPTASAGTVVTITIRPQ